MASTNILAFSSSRVGNGGYLEAAAPAIAGFLGDRPLHIAFIPFADASNDYAGYVARVRAGLGALPHHIEVAMPQTAAATVERADAVMVGGGNTFLLLHHLYQYKVLDVIRSKVLAGMPYIGWSAGANVAGLTIGTTNDMPIIEPQGFAALGLLPFQLNPHYLNVKPDGHNGETRDDRLGEYLLANPAATIVGLPEGTALLRQAQYLSLVGPVPAVIFTRGAQGGGVVKTAVAPGEDLSWLL